MSQRLELTGQRFGKLVAVRVAGKSRGGVLQWLCQCDCGKTAISQGSNLKRGKVFSCGCLRVEANTTHGQYRTALYKVWTGLIGRCTNRKNKRFADYGGRGITVCERWRHDFAAFCADMGVRPRGASLDRVDNNRGYEPNNCRWATAKEQQRNMRNNHIITFGGATRCLAAWAEHLNLSERTLRARVQRGWSIERALTTT